MNEIIISEEIRSNDYLDAGKSFTYAHPSINAYLNTGYSVKQIFFNEMKGKMLITVHLQKSDLK